MDRIKTRSPEETIEVGITLGRSLKKGDIVGLIGELGAGKTTFVKGIAQGINISNPDEVVSPSFTICNVYEGKFRLYHIDFYRIDHLDPETEMQIRDILDDDGIAVVEWAEKFPSVMGEKYIEVRIWITGENEREIEIRRE